MQGPQVWCKWGPCRKGSIHTGQLSDPRVTDCIPGLCCSLLSVSNKPMSPSFWCVIVFCVMVVTSAQWIYFRASFSSTQHSNGRYYKIQLLCWLYVLIKQSSFQRHWTSDWQLMKLWLKGALVINIPIDAFEGKTISENLPIIPANLYQSSMFYCSSHNCFSNPLWWKSAHISFKWYSFSKYV